MDKKLVQIARWICRTKANLGGTYRDVDMHHDQPWRAGWFMRQYRKMLSRI